MLVSLHFRGLAHVWVENLLKFPWIQHSQVIIWWAAASYKDPILQGNWIYVYGLTSLDRGPLWCLPLLCQFMSKCACAPTTTKSAENKISLADIKEKGKMICFQSQRTTFLSPRPFTSTGVAHVAKCCTMSACPLTQTKHSLETSMSDEQAGFSFEDLDVWGFGAVTHCFPSSEWWSTPADGRLVLNHRGEWWGGREGEERGGDSEWELVVVRSP